MAVVNPKTERLYAAAQANFALWCRRRGLTEFPGPNQIAVYLQEISLDRGRSVPPVHLAAIGKHYRTQGRALDTKSPFIQAVMTRCRASRAPRAPAPLLPSRTQRADRTEKSK
jgi:hypothetical protein